jgi:HipA N-terminal domain
LIVGELVLDVRLDGFADPVGVLARNDAGGLTFVYASDHLANPGALPVSLSLPLTDAPYGDVLTRVHQPRRRLAVQLSQNSAAPFISRCAYRPSFA